MNILLILAHPESTSFNAALAQAVSEELTSMGHHLVFLDLYREGFDPVISGSEIPENAALDPVVGAHCRELARADGLIIVHPNWWGMPPAILKGWVDRVFRPGVAYRFLEGDGGEGIPEGLLKAKAALVLNTSNTPQDREMEVFGDPLERLWKDCILQFCGIRKFHRRLFGVICTSSLEQRQAWLQEARDLARKVFPARKG